MHTCYLVSLSALKRIVCPPTFDEFVNPWTAKEWPALLCFWLAYPDIPPLTLTSPALLAYTQTIQPMKVMSTSQSDGEQGGSFLRYPRICKSAHSWVTLLQPEIHNTLQTEGGRWTETETHTSWWCYFISCRPAVCLFTLWATCLTRRSALTVHLKAFDTSWFVATKKMTDISKSCMWGLWGRVHKHSENESSKLLA